MGRTGLACDPTKLLAVQNWHAPDKVKGVRQFVGFVGYHRRFVKDFADLAEPLVALARKGAPCVWTDWQQQAFEALKACLISAPILGFPTENGRFVLDTEASLFAVGGVLSQLQDDREVVIGRWVSLWTQTDLLPELSGETLVASALLEELTADLLPAGVDLDLIATSRQDTTLATVWEWIQSGSIPVWAECAGLSPELRCWRLQVGNLSIDTDGRLWRRRAPPSVGSQLVVPQSERQSMIRRFHDSLFAGHLGISRTVSRLQTRVNWPGL